MPPSMAEPERVLLLTLTGADPARNERELAELEGLTRSAGARTVAVCRQRGGQINPQTLWDAENCRKQRWKSASKAPRW